MFTFTFTSPHTQLYPKGKQIWREVHVRAQMWIYLRKSLLVDELLVCDRRSVVLDLDLVSFRRSLWMERNESNLYFLDYRCCYFGLLTWYYRGCATARGPQWQMHVVICLLFPGKTAVLLCCGPMSHGIQLPIRSDTAWSSRSGDGPVHVCDRDHAVNYDNK